MTINIGFQMDPLEGLSLEDDTTLAIIEECLLRNYNIWYFLPKDVSYINGEIVTIDGGEIIQNSGEFNFLKNLPIKF